MMEMNNLDTRYIVCTTCGLDLKVEYAGKHEFRAGDRVVCPGCGNSAFVMCHQDQYNLLAAIKQRNSAELDITNILFGPVPPTEGKHD